MLERVSVAGNPQGCLQTGPGDEAAVLSNAHRGLSHVPSVEALGEGQGAQPHCIGLEDAPGDSHEGRDQPTIGDRVVGQPAVARDRGAKRFRDQISVIGGNVVMPPARGQDAGPGQVGERILERGPVVGGHQETPGAVAQRHLVVGEREDRGRRAALAGRQSPRGLDQPVPGAGRRSAEITLLRAGAQQQRRQQQAGAKRDEGSRAGGCHERRRRGTGKASASGILS